MNRDDFVQKAISRGLTDPIKLKAALTDYRNEVGAFDDDEPELPKVPTTSSEPQKGGFVQGAAEFITKDIPGEVVGAAGRTMDRARRIEAPTVLGEAAVEKTGTEGLAADVVESVAGTPERIGRAAGGAFGTLGEVPGLLMSVGVKAADKLTGGVVDKLIQSVGEKAVESKPVKALMKWWENLSPAEKANYTAAVDMTEAFGWKAGKVTGELVEGVGKGAVKKGTKLLGGDLKIKESLARRGYGQRIDVKKQNILDDIVTYDLESPTGNFSQMADKAKDLASQKVKAADEMLFNVAIGEDAPVGRFVDDIITEEYKKVKNVALGKRSNAKKIIDKIKADAVGDALAFSGPQEIGQLVEFKRLINEGEDIFVKGVFATTEDRLENKIRKSIYNNAVKKIRSISKEAADLNVEAKKLWDIEAVAGDAASRIRNKDQLISFSDKLIGGASGLGTVTALANQNPELAVKTILAGLTASAVTKAAGQGRGAAAIIRGGKTFKKIGKSRLLPIAGAGAVSNLKRASSQPDLFQGIENE